MYSDYYVRSCQLTATLYLTASVYNALVHCSLGVALGEAHHGNLMLEINV